MGFAVRAPDRHQVSVTSSIPSPVSLGETVGLLLRAPDRHHGPTALQARGANAVVEPFLVQNRVPERPGFARRDPGRGHSLDDSLTPSLADRAELNRYLKSEKRVCLHVVEIPSSLRKRAEDVIEYGLARLWIAHYDTDYAHAGDS